MLVWYTQRMDTPEQQNTAPATPATSTPPLPGLSQKIKDYSKEHPKALPVLGALVVVIALVALLVARGVVVVAIVNGQPVYRHQVLQTLESQYGKDTMDTLVLETVVRQELDKKNVWVSEEEVESEMQEINTLLSEQGQTLQDYLAFQGISEQSFRNNVMLNMRIRKTLEQEVTVSEEEIDSYIEENKEMFSEDVDTESEEFRSSIREQLADQKINESASAWVEKLRASASIKYLKTY